MSAVKKVDFISDKMSYIVMRGSWFNIFVLSVHVTSEEENDVSKGSFYEKLELVFCHLPKDQRKIPLGDVNVK
jgi:hypothetical protein